MNKLLILNILLLFSNLSNGQGANLSIPSFNPKGWELIWHDEFSNDNTIDQNWIAENGAPSNIQSSRWRENLNVNYGKLNIINKKQTKGEKNWTSGSLTSREKFKYGYFEARIKISKATGVNNSFWLYCTNPASKDGRCFEIDILEGHFPNIINTNIHDLGLPDKRINIQNSKQYKFSRNLSRSFHIFGLEWSNDSLNFFIDNKLVRSEFNYFCHDEGPIVLGTAVMNWAGEVTPMIAGTQMVVDYVRVYKRR